MHHCRRECHAASDRESRFCDGSLSHRSASCKAKSNETKDDRRAVPRRESVVGTRALRPPQKRSRLPRLQPVNAIGRGAPSSAVALRSPDRFEERRLRSFIQIGRHGTGRLFATSKSCEIHTIANAVRVAGPDRILLLALISGNSALNC